MIKELNSANAGIKRPLRVSDLQDIWTALNSIHTPDETYDTRILSGFNDNGDGTLSSGIVSKSGKLFYHPDIAGYKINIGSAVYGNTISGVDERVFSNGTTQDFSFNKIASVSSVGVSLGTFTLNYIAQRKVKKQYREVTGVLSVETDAGNPTATFTPDNVADSDITVNGNLNVTANSAGISLKDGNGERMLRHFVAVLEFSERTEQRIIANEVPDYLMVGRLGSTSDITVYYKNRIPVEDTYTTYRIKILFNV